MMKTLTLDAIGWQNSDDIYDAFFRAVRAPKWHFRNFNALRDSIATGSINEVEVPYRIVVKNAVTIGPNARQMLNDFKDLIEDLAASGCEIQIEVQE